MKTQLWTFIIILWLLPQVSMAHGTCFVGSDEDIDTCRARLEREMRKDAETEGVAWLESTTPSGQRLVCQVVGLEPTGDGGVDAPAGHHFIVTHSGYVSRYDSRHWLSTRQMTEADAVAFMISHPVCNGQQEPTLR